MFSNANLLESGNVGGGAFVAAIDRREQEIKCANGEVATLWDDQVACMAGGRSRTMTMQEKKVLILADIEGSHRGSQNSKGKI